MTEKKILIKTFVDDEFEIRIRQNPNSGYVPYSVSVRLNKPKTCWLGVGKFNTLEEAEVRFLELQE